MMEYSRVKSSRGEVPLPPTADSLIFPQRCSRSLVSYITPGTFLGLYYTNGSTQFKLKILFIEDHTYGPMKHCAVL